MNKYKRSNVRYDGKFFANRIEKIAVHAERRTDKLELLVILLSNDLYYLQKKVDRLENQMVAAQEWSPGMAPLPSAGI